MPEFRGKGPLESCLFACVIVCLPVIEFWERCFPRRKPRVALVRLFPIHVQSSSDDVRCSIKDLPGQRLCHDGLGIAMRGCNGTRARVVVSMMHQRLLWAQGLQPDHKPVAIKWPRSSCY